MQGIDIVFLYSIITVNVHSIVLFFSSFFQFSAAIPFLLSTFVVFFFGAFRCPDLKLAFDAYMPQLKQMNALELVRPKLNSLLLETARGYNALAIWQPLG